LISQKTDFPKDKVGQIRTRFLTFPLFPKVKEVQFKIINDIYPCNAFLRHRFNMDCNECTFCEADIESLEHLFFLCKFSKKFWDDLYNWLRLKYEIPDFNFKTIKYLSLSYDLEFLVNNIVLLANYFIHKCRFFKNPPTFSLFHKDLLIRLVHNKKALKLFNLLKILFDDSPLV